MKTLQQAIDALPAAELRRRKHRLAGWKREKWGTGRAGYFFPGQSKYPKRYQTSDQHTAREPSYDRHALDHCKAEKAAYERDPTPANYIALFLAANHLRRD